jgi:hypothetical protein
VFWTFSRNNLDTFSLFCPNGRRGWLGREGRDEWCTYIGEHRRSFRYRAMCHGYESETHKCLTAPNFPCRGLSWSVGGDVTRIASFGRPRPIRIRPGSAGFLLTPSTHGRLVSWPVAGLAWQRPSRAGGRIVPMSRARVGGSFRSILVRSCRSVGVYARTYGLVLCAHARR